MQFQSDELGSGVACAPSSPKRASRRRALMVSFRSVGRVFHWHGRCLHQIQGARMTSAHPPEILPLVRSFRGRNELHQLGGIVEPVFEFRIQRLMYAAALTPAASDAINFTSLM